MLCSKKSPALAVGDACRPWRSKIRHGPHRHLPWEGKGRVDKPSVRPWPVPELCGRRAPPMALALRRTSLYPQLLDCTCPSGLKYLLLREASTNISRKTSFHLCLCLFRWGETGRAGACLEAQPPPWLHQALITPRAEIAAKLSDWPRPEPAAPLSSLFLAKDRDMEASTQAG